MAKRLKPSILAIIIALTSFCTYGNAATAVTAYTKTLEQIYKSKDVYSDTQKRLQEFNKQYSAITSLFSAGKSVKKRELSVLKVGTGSKKIFINAAHHPREYIGTIVTLNQIQYILEAYNSNSTIDGVNIKSLLENQVTFYFMPLVNPDGVQICVNGSPSYYFNANKVDLNHNYDADWTKRITKTYSTGTTPFSEPETQAVKALCETIEFELTIAYHATGDIIYWYYGQQGDAKTRDLAYANILKNTTGYSLVSPSNYKSSTSGFKDWCVQKLKIPSFTIEVGGKRGLTRPVEWSMYSSIWTKNRLVPTRIANQLLKQKTFAGDKKTALIYKGSLTRLQNNLLLKEKINYISLADALSISSENMTVDQQNQLISTGVISNKIQYVSLDEFCKLFGLSGTYEKGVSTLYLE